MAFLGPLRAPRGAAITLSSLKHLWDPVLRAKSLCFCSFFFVFCEQSGWWYVGIKHWRGGEQVPLLCGDVLQHVPLPFLWPRAPVLHATGLVRVGREGGRGAGGRGEADDLG